MEAGALLGIGLAALATAALSAVVGMAGGITLLAILLLFLDPLQAIPLHGVIQLVSNASRSGFQRRHVEGWIVARFAALLLPGGLIGIWLAHSLPPQATRGAIGAFVLLATWAPGALLLGAHPERSDPRRRFVWLGGAAGILNLTVGATGPLIAPFFLNLGLTRQELVGTKAACQTLGHAVKIALFAGTGFAFAPHAPLLAVGTAGVLAGTWLGTRLLDRIDERTFTALYRVVLSIIALRLLLAPLWS